MNLQGTSAVGGAWLPKGPGPQWQAVNPASGEVLEPRFQAADLPALADAAVQAVQAFESAALAPAPVRAQLLDAVAREIEGLGDALLHRCVEETGLPLGRVTGERVRTCGQLRAFAALVTEGSWVDARIDAALPDRQPVPRPDLRRMLRALGPVAVFGASNFPLAFSVAGGDTASALAAGCPVIVKAHPAHPGTSELVAGAVMRAVAACGLPPGVFAMLHGGAEIGIALVQHPAVVAVGFTGSTRAGRALMDAAASRARPIPVFAEMSSVNPLVVTPAALAERGAAIAQGLSGSVLLGSGQFCTKPGLVFAVAGEATDRFAAALAGAIESAPAATLLTEGIRAAYESGGRRLAADRDLRYTASFADPASAAAIAARPALAVTSAEHFLSTASLEEEIFGPVAVLVVAQSWAELMSCLETLPGQLTASIHAGSNDEAPLDHLAALMARRAGRLIWNGYPTGVEVSPAMTHGGPYPAASDSRFTSVGTGAILRFARPVTYQGFPQRLLPEELQDANPRRIRRTVNGTVERTED